MNPSQEDKEKSDQKEEKGKGISKRKAIKKKEDEEPGIAL